MAIMGRKKQMIRQQIIGRRARERQESKEEEKPLSKEEHDKRVTLLKSMGLLKE